MVRVWRRSDHAPDHGIDARHPLVIGLDATVLDAHSEKQNAAPTWKRGFGFHPLCAFIDHGPDSTGEPAVLALRPGNAGSNTAADHKMVFAAALEQLPWQPGYRVGRKVLVRTDSGGGTHEFLGYCHRRRVQYSIGFTLTDDIVAAMDTHLRDQDWTPAYDADGQVRVGAWVVEVTGICDLSGWPPGMRLIVRRTASAPPRTPACGTCPSTVTTRTASGSHSSRWPWTCWPGCRCSPWPTTTPADGNRKPCACGCSRSRPASHATPAKLTYAYRPIIPGPHWPSPH